MTITDNELRQILPSASQSGRMLFLDGINNSMQKYEINTPLRIAAFIAQIGHESGSLKYVKEIASGQAYEGRKDLGNTHPGDGMKFKGRGLIQVTGRANYQKLSEAMELDFVTDPALLEQPRWATESAAWWWKNHGLNELADKGDFLKITRIINGGTNAFAERRTIYERAKKVLGA